MIHIVGAGNRAAQPRLFETMFEDRKRQFVDTLGWDVPVVDGRFEIDAFDRDGATYIVAADIDGAHRASLRLLPTDRPHLLDTHFAALCPLGVPSGKHVAEITRLCLPSRHGTAGRRTMRDALIAAMVDHALGAGISVLTGVVSEGFRREVLAMGWLAEPLGPAMRIEGGAIGAFALHLAADTPRRLAWTGIYPANAPEGRIAA